MSVKSAIFNSLFTTGQKINIAVSRILIDFYSIIRALAGAGARWNCLWVYICLKTVLYFCKRTVLKVLCYQNIYAEKHGEICTNTFVQGNQRKSSKINESLHVNIKFVDSPFFCQKSCQLLSYKSDTCTCFFFPSVLLQPLEAALVRTNNKCILSFALDNLQFVCTKAASNGCKRTLWKKNSYSIFYMYKTI